MVNPRVAILHYTALPVVGGVENVIGDHTRLLTEAGYPVTIVTGRGGDPGAFADVRVVLIPELDSEFPENQLIAQALERNVLAPEFEPLAARIETALMRQFAETDVVLVHNAFNFHFNLPLTAALYHLVDSRPPFKMVAWCHDISRYVNPSSGAEMQRGFPWDLLRTYRPEVRYIAVSTRRQHMLADILAIPQERVQVIPNGVSPELLLGLSDFGRRMVKQLDLFHSDLILLMPVRITQAKNIEFALRVTAALKRSGCITRLVITGPPDPHDSENERYFDELLALCHKLQLDHEVIFLSQGTEDMPGPLTIGPEQVAEFYRLADIVFMPSHREGFGLPVLEGGLVRKPVFATMIPAVDEVGPENVYTIASDESPEHVAARMREWAEHDVEQRLLHRVRHDYTWQAIFECEIVPLIAACVGNAED
jgi:mannosylglucosylglycerate synthase